MYDFLFQEEWWMETIIAAAITGVVTLVAAYIMYATKVEKKLEKIEDSSLRMEGQNSSILDKGESQTKLLSGEHRDLSKEQSDIKSEIQKVIANQEKEKAVREAYGKVIPEGDTFKHMADAIYMHSVQLQQEVNTLKNQNTQLENQIVQLENQNRDLKQQIIALKERLSKEQEKPIERHPEETEKNEYDEILDNMDLSPDSHDEEEWER